MRMRVYYFILSFVENNLEENKLLYKITTQIYRLIRKCYLLCHNQNSRLL